MASAGAASFPGRGSGVLLISVILPVYNGEPYLADAVESIRSQSFADFELLAIDDQSADGSARYLQRMVERDPRIRLLSNPRKGLVEALNLGLASARGAFIARMDADDVSAPDRFQRQADFLTANPAIAVVGSAMTLIDGAGQVIGETDYPTEPARIHRALDRMSCALAHPTVMARRSVLAGLGGYREGLRYAEDYDLWLRVAEGHRLANLPERLLRYRRHDGSVSQTHSYNQQLATHVAWLCARARRSGHGDPMAGFDNLSMADLLRFDIADGERVRILRALLATLPRHAQAGPA